MSSINNVSAINLAAYQLPEVVEVSSRRWVQYGEENNYYEYLTNLINSSSIHSAIVKGTTDLIFGEGFNPIKELEQEDLRRMAWDMYALGNVAVNVIWDSKGEKVVKIKHLPVQNVRPSKMDERGKIHSYWVSADWSDMRKNKPVEYCSFDPQKAKGENAERSQIQFMRPYKSGFYYFSPVDYQGSISYIELDKEIANFHLNNAKNGLTPSMVFKFRNGIPDPEAQRQLENKIKKKFGGSGGSTLMLTFSESGDDSLEVDVLPDSDADKKYTFLSEEVTRKVLAGHRVTSPLLFGIRGGDGFGSNADEIKQSFLLYEETVIMPKQAFLAENINKVLAFAGQSIEIKTSKPKAWFDEESGADTE